MILSNDVADMRNGNSFAIGGGGVTSVAMRVGNGQAVSCEVCMLFNNNY